jgi:hypothetical protein
LALIAVGFVVPACAAEAPQFNVCPGTYALCTTAVCTRTADPKLLDCTCTVNQGFSVGGGTQSQCPAASPGSIILSRYFPIPSYQVCTSAPSANRPWADCLDVPCTIDPNNKTMAQCRCKAVDQGTYEDKPSHPWLITTGQVATNLCATTTIYSSATTAASQQITAALNTYAASHPLDPLSVPTELQMK